MRQIPDQKPHRATLVPGIIVVFWLASAILLAAAPRAAGELIFTPRLTSPDATEVVRAYFAARQWGYRGLSERALAPEVRKTLHAPNMVCPFVDDPFLARDLVVYAPQATPLYGEYDEELLFVVTYRSRWRQVTGAPPGPRGWFVYAGRDAGGPWRILAQRTGL